MPHSKVNFGLTREGLRWLISMTVGVLIGLFTQAGVKAEVAQMPLYLTSKLDPNILFVLDDSGSMQFEIMPDDYTYWGLSNGSVIFVFPRYDDVYGSSDYSNYVATVDSNAAFNAVVRSPQFNKVYYNPAVTYTPWVHYDGSSYPNAVQTCALHNPQRSGTTAEYCRNLTVDNTNSPSTRWSNCNSTSCSSAWVTKTFWPATYFYYNGGGQWTWGNYTKVEIRSTTSTYTGHGRENRTDCANAASGSCTYSEEIQNFANWYTYYRSRILSARAGIGKAFAEQEVGMRVGFGAINQGSSSIDGVATTTLIQGVRPFSGTNRQAFFTNLYDHAIPAQGTPLRRALDAAGQYYCRADNAGPWGNTPGTDDSTAHPSCRHSYTILMTDGYWTEGDEYRAATADARDNNDGSTENSTTNTNPNSSGDDYTYSPANPFQDDRTNTLADVAMYYWKRDLRTNLANAVPTSALDPAFWQHMVTFGVGLGVSGSISPSDAWNAVSTGAAVAWPNPVGSESGKIDDLLHASVNGRGGFFSAADPDTFSSQLADVLADIVERIESSAASIATNTTRLGTDTMIYQAKFNSDDWSGQIVAYNVESDGSVGAVEWDSNNTDQIPAYNLRNIYTFNGSSGQDFTETAWDDNLLSTAQKTALQAAGTEAVGKDRLSWLRGYAGKEQRNGGPYRNRSKLLGDIVNSDPAFVGKSGFRYDHLEETVAGQNTYSLFQTATANRSKMLYVGANDGMLHAFDTATGVEQFAFIPNGVFSNLASLTDPDYTHKYFVDGSPYIGDAYIGGSWKTVLLGTTGAGGRSVFALDVTYLDFDGTNYHPNSNYFDKTKVLWEFTDSDLGYTIGQPVIARMRTGQWAAVFGNGYGSDNHRAFLFIVDIETGELIKKIDTTVGASDARNGLATPALLADNYRTIEYAYAGDLLGNLWKFDLTATNINSWAVAYKQGSTPKPLFTARSALGQIQPITAPLEILSHSPSGYLVLFGTGKYFETGDNIIDADPPAQSFYGIHDNLLTRITATDRSASDFPLQEQEIIDELTVSSAEVRVTTQNPVNYTDTSDPVNNPVKRGWYMDLVSPDNGAEGERVVSSPLIRSGRIIFTTLIPSSNPCEYGGTSWLMELDAKTGARLDYSVFDLGGDHLFNEADYITVTIDGETITVPASGLKSEVGIIKTPAVISAGEVEYKFFGGSTGEIASVNEVGSAQSGRQSWRQIR